MANASRPSDAKPCEARAEPAYRSSGEFGIVLGRGFVGALIFSLPMLMTMELWSLGFTMAPLRLALLLAVLFPMLVKLARYGGLRRTVSVVDDIADALIAIGIAFVASSLILWIFGVISWDMPLRETLGKVALQTFCASIGAMLGQNQLGAKDEDDEEAEADASYAGELFLMVVGALFLSLNVAPTEEIVLLAYRMEVWQEVLLAVLTIVLMHAFVYSLEFHGTEEPHPGETFWSVFARFTLVGYALVLLVSLYVLWTFGRFDGTAPIEILSAAIVLSLPGAVGAAVARLIL